MEDKTEDGKVFHPTVTARGTAILAAVGRRAAAQSSGSWWAYQLKNW